MLGSAPWHIRRLAMHLTIGAACTSAMPLHRLVAWHSGCTRASVPVTANSSNLNRQRAQGKHVKVRLEVGLSPWPSMGA